MIPGPERGGPDRAEASGIRPYLRGTEPLPPAPPGEPEPRHFAARPTGRSTPETPDPGTPPALRPFVLTAGRVDEGDTRLGFETQVTAMPGVRPRRLSPEAGAIVAICEKPISVAEISARLRLHLGVTKILVGDLHTAGYLTVHALDTETPDPDTILRVIHGLRSIF